MRVIAIANDSPTAALTLSEAAAPSASASEVVIAVAAAGVNRADLLQVKGLYPPPPGAPEWPGLEVSGVISQVGEHVSRWNVGDQVCALLPGGGYAEYVAVDHSLVLPAPAGLPLRDAAALVEAACTVWSVLRAANAAPSETMLVHGGSGGIGSFAVQYGVARGLRVVATAGSPDRVQACLDLGASAAFDYRQDTWSHHLAKEGGVDILLDVMGGAYLDRNVTALATGGRLAIIGLQGGRRGEVDLGALLGKRATVLGLTLRSRPLAERAAIVAGVERDVWPLVPYAVAPVIAGVFPLADAHKAHRTLEAGGVVGKLLLTP